MLRVLFATFFAILLGACATQSNPAPEFKVNAAQGKSLQKVVSEVNRQVLGLPQHRFRLTTVRDLFASYDSEVREFLSAEQYVVYDESYRDYLAERVYDTIRNPGGFRSRSEFGDGHIPGFDLSENM